MRTGKIVGIVLLVLFLTSLGVWLYGESQIGTNRANGTVCSRMASKAVLLVVAVATGLLSFRMMRRLL